MGGLDLSSLTTIPISYATCSLGSPNSPPPLLDRLDAISKAEFSAVELSFPDILSYGQTLLGHEIEPKNYDELEKVAGDIKKECDKRSLVIMMLQPFANFEGWPHGSDERRDAFERLDGWIRIMRAAGTDLLQVGSTDVKLERLDESLFVPDLQELADKLAKHGFRVAYENWCWSTHAPDWKDVWKVVQKVDRPNIGLCLDTFQTAGGEWADPRTESGLLEDVPKDEMEERFNKSLEELSKTIPKDKIYLLQISDGYKVPQAFEDKRDGDGLLPRGRWSHDFRPLPYNGGYLPVADVARAVLNTGFRGWFSYEVFDGGKDGKSGEVDIVAYARTAKNVQERLLAECAGEKIPEEIATR